MSEGSEIRKGKMIQDAKRMSAVKKTAVKLIVLVALGLVLAGCGKKEKAVTGINVEVPEGFNKSTESEMALWTAPDYPSDASVVVMMEVSEDQSAAGKTEFGLLTSELLKTSTEKQYESTYGISADVNVDSFERLDIDSEKAIIATLTCEIQGIKVEQITCYIYANKLYNVVYTQVGDAVWFDTFRTCAESITMIRE